MKYALALILALGVEALLLYQILTGNVLVATTLLWITLHVIASALAAWAVAALLSRWFEHFGTRLGVAAFLISLTIPLFGAAGLLVALLYGTHQARQRHQTDVYWQFTSNAQLPYTTPIGRAEAKYDSRSFVEQLSFSGDHDDLYRKVLSARNIRNGLSVGALKKAIAHSDERIRLTAYQILDRKVSTLNSEIQRLEKDAQTQQNADKSNTWLQIASNYWELLTLEKDEPVARAQLLDNASSAAGNSLKILPSNRNAHFVAGRIALLQGKDRVASVAFKRAIALGMPEEKVLPYMAEAAFVARDFNEVSALINRVDDAFKVYPPLRPVADYWS